MTAYADSPNHTLTWVGDSGVVNAKTNIYDLIFIYDGKEYNYISTLHDFAHLPDNFYLKSGAIVDVLFPDQANIQNMQFRIPLAGSQILNLWLRAGVKLVYHYKGKVLPRHELTCELNARDGDMGHAQFTFDSKPLGTISATVPWLLNYAWEENTFLHVRCVRNVSSESPGSMVEFPNQITDGLKTRGVHLEYDFQFSDDSKSVIGFDEFMKKSGM
jgi:hypothetical protein